MPNENKWIADCIEGNDRLLVMFGKMPDESEFAGRIGLWVLIPETITVEQVNDLVNDIKNLCEKKLTIQDIVKQ